MILASERDPHRPKSSAAKRARPPNPAHVPLAEKLGRVWAWIFLGIVLILAVVLVGKAFLSKGG